MSTITQATRKAVLATVQDMVGRDLSNMKNLLDKIEAQNRAMVVALHNKTVELDAANKRSDAVIKLLLELFDQPAKHNDAVKIVQEFFFGTRRKGATT